MSSLSNSLRLSCLLALLPASVLPLFAQEPAASQEQAHQVQGHLSLKECVARALQKNFDIKIQDFDVLNSKESLTVAKADFNPVFTLSAERSGSQDYVTRQDADSTQTRAGVSQKITTGAVVSLSGLMSRDGRNPYLLTPNPVYNSDLTLAVSQPLLKGLGPTVSKANIERARIGVNRAGLDYKGQVLKVISDVEVAYVNLCYAREELEVKKHSFKLANTLLEEATVRWQSGVATELDTLQAEYGVANARRNLLQSTQNVKDSEDALLILIGQGELGTQVGAVEFPNLKPLETTFDASYKLARENQPSLLSVYAQQKQFDLDTKTAKNGRLPSLNLDAAVGYNTRESSASESINQLSSLDGNAWQVGLSLNIPWGLKAENARYRTALNNSSQNQTRIQRIEQNLMANVRAAVRTVLTNEESVVISAKATELSNRKYELEMARFSAGTSTARRTLEAQDDLENARISELQAKVSLRRAVSALHLLEGSSPGYYNITLP